MADRLNGTGNSWSTLPTSSVVSDPRSHICSKIRRRQNTVVVKTTESFHHHHRPVVLLLFLLKWVLKLCAKPLINIKSKIRTNKTGAAFSLVIWGVKGRGDEAYPPRWLCPSRKLTVGNWRRSCWARQSMLEPPLCHVFLFCHLHAGIWSAHPPLVVEPRADFILVINFGCFRCLLLYSVLSFSYQHSYPANTFTHLIIMFSLVSGHFLWFLAHWVQLLVITLKDW